MSFRRRSLLLIALLSASALLPAVAPAQGARVWSRTQGGGRLIQLGEDIMVLQRLVPLNLTDAQLRAVLEAYRQKPEELTNEQTEAAQRLEAMRTRLIGGSPLLATDLATLREVWRTAARPKRDGEETDPAQEELSPLAQSIWKLLDQTQRAALLGDVRGAAANNQKFERVAATRALAVIARLRQTDDTSWAASRDRLAGCLAAGAGPAGSAARENARLMLVDYLTRLRKMPQADFSRKQDELVAELGALMPPGSSLTAAMAEFEPRLIAAAMASTFLHPRAAALLEEIKAARAAQAGTPAGQ